MLLTLQPATPTLAQHDEPQLCYVLITISAGRSGAGRPVNWSIVADASRSMRIPIVSEDQFRELVRSGGAQEVLVDGVPVWQLTDPVPDSIRNNAPSALDQVARALHSVVEHLDRSDHFSLVACAEQAMIVVPSSSGAERTALVRNIARLKSLRLGETTDLAAGMQLGLQQLARGRQVAPLAEAAERLLLLTDGFTLNAEACLDLARRAADEGVAVSTLGLGGEFQADLLTALADLSGGQAVFLRHTDAIPAAIATELAAARTITTRTVGLQIILSRGVALRHITRLNPALAPLELYSDPSGYSIYLGDLEPDEPARLLCELIAPPAPRRAGAPSISVRLAQIRLSSDGSATTAHDLVVVYTAAPEPMPPSVLSAAALANIARLQKRALGAAGRGDRAEAVALLRNAASRLRALGEATLADATLQEAAVLEHTGQSTGVGMRDLVYRTRRLGQQER